MGDRKMMRKKQIDDQYLCGVKREIRLRLLMVLASTALAAVLLCGGCGTATQEEKEAIKAEGIAAMEAGDYETAVDKFDEVLAMSGGTVNAHVVDTCYYKAAALYAQGNLQEAIDVYSSVIAYDEEAQILKHYRVDKMESITVLDDARIGGENFEKFDIAGYSKSVFSMFGGEEADVTLSVDNSLVGVIADRFGSDVFITRESDSTFWVSVKVMLSPQFYAWVFGLGNKVRIISPESVVRDYKTKIADVLAKYEEK